MNVDTDLLSLSKLKVNFYWIHEAKLNYDERINLCYRSYFLIQSLEGKSKKSSNLKPKSRHVEI